MSSDAKVWMDEKGWFTWKGIHDGSCSSDIPHSQGDNLSSLLNDIELCRGKALRWEIRKYPDGKVGLVGWET